MIVTIERDTILDLVFNDKLKRKLLIKLYADNNREMDAGRFAKGVNPACKEFKILFQLEGDLWTTEFKEYGHKDITRKLAPLMYECYLIPSEAIWVTNYTIIQKMRKLTSVDQWDNIA